MAYSINYNKLEFWESYTPAHEAALIFREIQDRLQLIVIRPHGEFDYFHIWT